MTEVNFVQAMRGALMAASRATDKMMQATILHRLRKHTVNHQNSGSLTKFSLYVVD